MAHAVQKVAQRCEDAKENGGSVDLSECKLLMVPDGIFFLLRTTKITSCSLAHNALKRIPPKLPRTFCLVKDLNLSSNKMSSLPEELTEMTHLEMVDISFNEFRELPQVLFKLSYIKDIKANNNNIQELVTTDLKIPDSLININLEANPLSPETTEHLQTNHIIRI